MRIYPKVGELTPPRIFIPVASTRQSIDPYCELLSAMKTRFDREGYSVAVVQMCNDLEGMHHAAHKFYGGAA